MTRTLTQSHEVAARCLISSRGDLRTPSGEQQVPGEACFSLLLAGLARLPCRDMEEGGERLRVLRVGVVRTGDLVGVVSDVVENFSLLVGVVFPLVGVV